MFSPLVKLILPFNQKTMFKHILIAFFLLIYPFFAKSTIHFNELEMTGPVHSFFTDKQEKRIVHIIDAGDTVVVNLKDIILQNQRILVPVSLITDDVIVSFDFSFKFNRIDFEFDTITFKNPMSGLQTLLKDRIATDSVVSYSSNTFPGKYNTSEPIIYLHFKALNGRDLRAEDFVIKNALPNGEPCSLKFIENVSTGTNNVNKVLVKPVFPNPANDKITIEPAYNSRFEIYDINGRKVSETFNASAGNAKDLVIGHLEEGIYFLRTLADGAVNYDRFIIQR